MSQFLYFIPGLPRPALPRAEVAATFARTALWDLVRSDKTWQTDEVICNPLHQDGPGGQTGTIFAVLPGGMITDESFAVDYRPGLQTWIKITDAGPVAWLGWYTDNPPTERSLRRMLWFTGEQVTLNDDCEWTAPIIRNHSPGAKVTLPMSVGLNDSGVRVMTVKPQYQRWVNLAKRIWDNEDLPLGELWDKAAEVLSLNYRVGPYEVNALGLFEIVDDASGQVANWYQILQAAIDWRTVTELVGEIEKKNTQPPA